MNQMHQSPLTEKAKQALSNAVAKVVADHRMRSRPLAVWRDGKAVWISPTEAGSLHEKAPVYKIDSRDAKS